MSRRPPGVRGALLFAFLLGSLTLVVWRQSQALDLLRELDAVREERVLAEARRSSLGRRIEALESRARVTVDARDRLGMRLPAGDEIVILPLRTPASALAVSGSGRPGGGGGDGG